jgi:hypothetical protein
MEDFTMKKVMLVVLFALLAMSFAMAQGKGTGNDGAFIPSTDVLGAHNNGGRGCAGCHAPHSGGRGSGGQTVVGSVASAGGNEGDVNLWGTDVSLITSETLYFGNVTTSHLTGGQVSGKGAYVVNFGGQTQWVTGVSPLVSGVASCLSCHDGQVSKGAMMMNQSYEQQALLLPNGAGFGAYKGALYGTVAIPTLLGSDGGTMGDYTNDHPVGPFANIIAVAGNTIAPSGGINYSVSGTTINWSAPTAQYATFVANYGAPAVASLVVDATNQVPYVVCTTCHNQHQMNVFQQHSVPQYGSNAGNLAAANPYDIIAGNADWATFPTYFFVNSPYNPGAAWTPTAAPSTTQFCRQCHFGNANESYGVTAVGTAF